MDPVQVFSMIGNQSSAQGFNPGLGVLIRCALKGHQNAHAASNSYLPKNAPSSAVASLWRDPFPLCGRAVARRAEEVLAPLSGRILGWRIPRVETPTPQGLRRGQVIRLYQTLA
jgi:hypothetical protein